MTSNRPWGEGGEHHESSRGSCGAGANVAGPSAILSDPAAGLKRAESCLSISSLQRLLRLHQGLRKHSLQQPPALLIGLAELLLQLVRLLVTVAKKKDYHQNTPREMLLITA